MKTENEITQEKLDSYFKITKKALSEAQITIPKKTHLHKTAQDFKDMAQRYYNDALYFKEKGNLVNSFGALNYAHGWLDAGARVGLFDVNHNSKLFVVE